MKVLDSLKLRSNARRSMIAVVIAVAGTAGLTAWAQPAPGEGPPHGWHRGGPGGPGPGPGGMMVFDGHGLQRMLDEADATTAQRSQIKDIVRAAHADLEAQRQAGAGLHQQAIQIFTQPTVDANAAEVLRQQTLAQYDQASKRMLQAALDISRVLTPDQRAKIGARLQKHMASMQQHMQERAQNRAPQPGATKQ